MVEVCPKTEERFNFQFTRSCTPVCLPIDQDLPPPPKDKCLKDAARDGDCCNRIRRRINTVLVIMIILGLYYCFVYEQDKCTTEATILPFTTAKTTASATATTTTPTTTTGDPCFNGRIVNNNSYFNCYGRYYSKHCEQECPSDFQILRNDVTSSTDEEFVGCYLIVRTRMTWDNASAYCLERNASLLVIDSEVENIMISRAVYEMGDTLVPDAHIWLALRRQNDKCTCTFVWQPALRPQTELGYENWAVSEPNCHNNEEFCVAVTDPTYPQPYRWNDFTCSFEVFFVCEF